MQNNKIKEIILNWSDELNTSLLNSDSFCIALFNIEGTLLFANKAISAFLTEEPNASLINPSFNKLLACENSEPLIFSGFLTLGDYNSINVCIEANIYRKNDQILILGGANTTQLFEQNERMHHLNREVSNLQRKLIKEKNLLEITLKQLEEVNSKLHELNVTKDKFFSIIAHDLKSPFNSILGFSKLLADGAPYYSTDKTQKLAHSIHDSSKNTFELLENLLEWTRLQRGKIIPNFTKINVNETSLDVQLLCEPIALSKDINLEFELDSTFYVRADNQMLKTVLRNLISNALKFTYPNGNVKVIAKNLENDILFIISDTGIGIESKYLNNLFSIDCNLSNKGTADEKGTGLGLILCKEFIENQNGKIWVESEIGKGSEFKFTLPKY
ncbi:Signal transduction histidine kinase [Lutibacter oricola]|uniref:histidine kinase n=1 Tax=Lutibacter oricola TaxID=762486 RepID=A0A1H3F3D3_9FLAO|nr:HAMP domain-containing sensor histidine kinase [Lutibacter oricola]SDX85425.1 Signal transduction histidine kinase [Lutibacter oricola]